MARVFLDTNILIYAFDVREHAKHEQALAIVRSIVQSESGFVSTQVLGEFFFASTGKRHGFLTPDQAQGQLRNMADAFQVLDVTRAVALDAARVARIYQLSYWDAQLCVVAAQNTVPFLLTEDLQDGQDVEGVHLLNPFRKTFDLDALLALP